MIDAYGDVDITPVLASVAAQGILALGNLDHSPDAVAKTARLGAAAAMLKL